MRLGRFLGVLALLLTAVPQAVGQNIVLTGDSADLTFFWNTNNDQQWDVVFRRKDTTEASGLTNPYDRLGKQGASANDFRFDSLLVQVTNPNVGTFNGDSFFTIGPDEDVATGRPDLGIRTRLRDTDSNNNNAVYQQFNSVSLTLDWANSLKPVGAEFLLANEDLSLAFLDTKSGVFNFNYPNWGHDHVVYGFSQLGDYNLQFTISGDINEFDGTNWVPSGSISSRTFNVAFSVVPEPGTLGLLALGLGCVVTTRRSRRS
jgi:hypothetical protein